MMCVILFLPSHSSRVLSGNDLIGGMMNTPRLRRGWGIASSSNLFFCLYWYSCILLVYFVCDSASEFGAMGSTSFLGVFLP